MQQLAHRRRYDDHLSLAAFGESVAEGLDRFVAAKRRDGREVERFAQTRTADLREPAAPVDRAARPVMRRHQSGISRRLARTFEARDLTEFGQHQRRCELPDAGNRLQQVAPARELRTALGVGVDLLFELVDLLLDRPDHRSKRIGDRFVGSSAKLVVEAIPFLFERLEAACHLAKRALFFGRRFPLRGLLTLREAGQERCVGAIRLRALQLTFGVSARAAWVDHRDMNACLVQKEGSLLFVAAGGFETDAQASGAAGQAFGPAQKRFEAARGVACTFSVQLGFPRLSG